MISFPFDSQITGAQELDVPGGGQKAVIPLLDRGYTAEDLQNIYKQLYTDGISSSITDCLKVSPGTGMQVIVSPGFCMAGGAFGCLEKAKTLKISTASSSDRIDIVVARRDNNNAYRNIDVYVVKGTPSSSPVAPQPTRNDSVYEIVLAHVFIARGTSSISEYRITDTRLNTSLCGIMQPKPGVDTTGIFDQYQAALNEFLDTVRQALDETLAGNLQIQIDEIKESPIDTSEEILANELQKVPAGAKGVKEIYDSIIKLLGTSIFVKDYQLDNQNLSAKSTEIFEVQVPVIDGFSRGMFNCSVYNATSSGANSSFCTIYQQLISGNTVRVAVRNNGSSSAKIRINVRMEYINNKLIYSGQSSVSN